MSNILLIDDNRNFQIGLAANLRKEGFKVVTASNGDDGIRIAQDVLPEIILCDYKMPGTDGMEVKYALNSEPATAEIPFIFLSAFAAADQRILGLSAGAEDYIAKPFNIEELIARIHTVLRRKEQADFHARQEVQQLLARLQTTLPVHTSHIFRTYVGMILLSLGMAKCQADQSEPALQIAYESTYRLKGLVNDLIWLNEIDLNQGEMYKEQTNLELSFSLPIEELVETWRAKNLEVNIEIEPSVVLITSVQRFTQSVCHLVENACKFSPEGGKIQVDLRSNGLGGCVLTIEDEGPGIPPAFHEIVFKRFFQLPDEKELPQNHGLGLGLYLARSFAWAQGGDLVILPSDNGCHIQMVLPSVKRRERNL